MDQTNGATDTAGTKAEFFAAGMHMFHITGFPQRSGVLTRKTAAPQGARLDTWGTSPDSDRHIPGPGAEGAAHSAQAFSVTNSGNKTLHAPKRPTPRTSISPPSRTLRRLGERTAVVCVPSST